MSFFLIWRFYFVCFLWRRRARETLLSLITVNFDTCWIKSEDRPCTLLVSCVDPEEALVFEATLWSPPRVTSHQRRECALCLPQIQGKASGQRKKKNRKGKVGESEGAVAAFLFSFFFFYHGHFKTQNFPEYCNIPPMCSSPSFKSHPPKAVSFHLCALSPIRVYSFKSQHHVIAFIDISMWISKRLFRNYVNCV